MKQLHVVSEFREIYGFENYSDHFSQKAINAILESVEYAGYKASFLGGVDNLLKAVHNRDNYDNQYFLNLSDGRTEHSRKAQAPVLLEMLGAHYSGSDAEHHLIMMDKYLSKEIASKSGVSVPCGTMVFKEDLSNLPSLNFSGPFIVKPNNQGSSVGIEANCFCYKATEAIKISKKIAKSFNIAIIESYISGIELTVFMLGNKTSFELLEIIVYGYGDQIILENIIFCNEIKKKRLRTAHRPEKILEKSMIKHIKDTSIRLFNEFQCRDIARIDYRLSKSNQLYFLEINGLPMMSATSELGLIANWKETTFNDLFKKFINVFIERCS